MRFDQKRIITLAGTLVLAGAVVAAGIYGPGAWKVFWDKNARSDQVVIQNPPVDQASSTSQGTEITGKSTDGSSTGKVTSSSGNLSATGTTTTPQADVSGTKKYKEPDIKLMELAPSISGYFSATGDSGLSDSAKTLAFQSVWNIHEYVDGYLFGPSAGPQMNEQDIKKYIVFHKSLWEKQLKSEAGAVKAAALTDYMETLLNRGIDAFDSKDKARIELFHQEIHDMDSHLFRNDTSAKVYGATPFATKR